MAIAHTGTTPARAALSFGTDHYRGMDDDQLKRIYRAARTAHASVFGADESRALATHTRDYVVSDTTLAAARGRNAVAQTCAFVSMVIGELCDRDTVVIPASPESREWSQTEGGHRIFTATDGTSAIVADFMAA